MWDTVSATIVYLNLIHSSGWGFPAVRNGSLCAKSTEWHRRAVHFTKGSAVLWPSRPAEGRDKLALRWRQHSGTEPMSTSTQQAQDPEWSGITGRERGFLFSFLSFFLQPRRPKHYQSYPQAHVRVLHQWASINQRKEKKNKVFRFGIRLSLLIIRRHS